MEIENQPQTSVMQPLYRKAIDNITVAADTQKGSHAAAFLLHEMKKIFYKWIASP
jgi:hypothetical protein